LQLYGERTRLCEKKVRMKREEEAVRLNGENHVKKAARSRVAFFFYRSTPYPSATAVAYHAIN
jgi:hypothetical protein